MPEAKTIVRPSGRPDVLTQAILFALEFVDPVTKQAVSQGIFPEIKNLSPPKLTASSRFVWRASGEKLGEFVTVKYRMTNPKYSLPLGSDRIKLPDPDDPDTKPADFLRQIKLHTTAFYTAPDGITAISGRLADKKDGKTPVRGASIRIEVSTDGGTDSFASTHLTTSNDNGEFLAMLVGLSDQHLQAEPGQPGTIASWLKISDSASAADIVPELPLRPGRHTFLVQPILWPPPEPENPEL